MNLAFRLFLLPLMLSAISCSSDSERMNESKLYLTNHSEGGYDSIYYKVFINDRLVVETPYKNQYLSHHWSDYKIMVPRDTFHLQVSVSGTDYQLQKDTMMMLDEDKSLFVLYHFTPSKDKYLNPEIYKLWDQNTDLREFADSLYNNNLINRDYLLDTVPSEKYIRISVAQVEE